MSIIYKIFDPLGLLAPITIKFKILLQKVTRAGLEWDEPMQIGLAKEAGTALEEMVLMDDVTYPCSVKPAGSKGLPELCGWWDGGKPASAAFLYSRYELEEVGSKGETHSCRQGKSDALV